MNELGIDLRYNFCTGSINKILRYQLIKASNSISARSFHNDRLTYQGDVPTQLQFTISENHDLSKTVKHGNCFNLNDFTYKVLDTFFHSKSSADCEVTSSVNPLISVGTRDNFDYALINR